MPGRVAENLAESGGHRHRLNIRLTDAEADVLDCNAKKAGMSKSRYLRSLITGQHSFIMVDKEALLSIYRELAAHGNNLNQIAHELHLAMDKVNTSDFQIAATLDQIQKSQQGRISSYESFVECMKIAIGR